MEALFALDPWMALATLTMLEIVLGIDNLVFISVISDRLPADQAPRARRLGLMGALFTRVLLLLVLSWAAHLTRPLFAVGAHVVSARDLVLGLGGLFLLGKATREIHGEVEGRAESAAPPVARRFAFVILQIMTLDVVFSLDSVITAIGMTDRIPVMIAAIAIAIGVMMWAAETVSAFIRRHPTTRMLALAFLLLIGVALVADALHFHIPRGYLYFAIAFSLFVEGLNILTRRKKRRAAPRKP